MATTYRRTNTDSGLGGGTDFNKAVLLPASDTTGSTALAGIGTGASSTSRAFTDVDVPGAAGVTGNYTVELEITTGNTSLQVSVQLHRVNSSGTIQTSGAASAEQQGSAGTKTFTFTGLSLGTWAAGDRLRIDFIFRNSAHGNQSLTVSHGGANNEVIAPWDISQALVKIEGETTEAAEVNLRPRVLARVQGESKEIAEATIRKVGLLRLQGETVELAEASIDLLGRTKIENESGEVAEVDIHYLGRIKQEGETIEIAPPGGAGSPPILEEADTQIFQTEFDAFNPWPVPKPTNLANGDYVLLLASIDGNQALSWPTDFVEIDEENDPGSAFTLAAAVKEITNAAGEPATYDIGNTTGERGIAIALRISGADGTTFLDVARSVNSGSGTTITATGLTTVTANTLLIALVGRDNASGPWFTPVTSGWTEHVDDGTGGGATSGAGAAIMHKTQASAGSTGNFEGTLTSAPWVAFMIAVRPAAGGGGSEAIAILGKVQVHTESLEISEQDLRTRQLVRLQGEEIQTSEAVLRFLNLLRLQGESVDISEQVLHFVVAGAQAIVKVQNESVEIGEQDLRFLGLVRVEGETIQLSETDSTFRALTRIQTETIEISEQVLRFLALVRVHNEETQLAEVVIPALDLLRLQTESVDISETDLRIRGIFRIENEDIDISETDLRVRGIFRVQNEDINFFETDLHFLALTRIQDESVQISEQVLRNMALVRLINETSNLSEQDLRFLAIVRVQDESIQVSEQDLRFRDLLHLVSESVQVSETDLVIVTPAGAMIVKIEGESVEITEAHLSFRALTRLQAESLPLDEQILRLRSLTRGQSEIQEVVEAVIRARIMLRTEAESVEVSEDATFIRGLAAKIVNETIEISESMLAFARVAISGVLRKWRDFAQRDREPGSGDRDYNTDDRDYD